MSNVTKLPIQRSAGRPPAAVPKSVDVGIIEAMAQFVDIDDDAKIRVSTKVDGWLKDLIEKSVPREVTVQGLLLLGLKELGYPTTKDELRSLLGEVPENE